MRRLMTRFHTRRATERSFMRRQTPISARCTLRDRRVGETENHRFRARTVWDLRLSAKKREFLLCLYERVQLCRGRIHGRSGLFTIRNALNRHWLWNDAFCELGFRFPFPYCMVDKGMDGCDKW